MQKTNETELSAENFIKRKDDKLYIKWKGYDNSTDSWTDKKDIVTWNVSIFQNHTPAVKAK